MMKKFTKTMKFKISGSSLLYKLLRQAQYGSWKVKNKAITMAFDWSDFQFRYKDYFGEYPKDKDVLGKTVSADIRSKAKEGITPEVSSTILYESGREAFQKFSERRKEVLNGRESLATYRKDGSFPMRASGIKSLTRESSKKYSVSLSLLSREGAKQYGVKAQVPATLLAKGKAGVILDRIISGEYKMCDSSISNRGKDWFLNIAYQFEKEEVQLDKSKVVGVDLGIVNAAYLATNFDDYERLVIEGGEISTFRQRVEARRRSMLRQTKYCGEGRKGHGRKTLLKPTEKLQHKVDDFRKTTNHKYSKAIVEFAEKNGCGVIQVEDLSGISNRDKFLSNWSYYELQEFIKYKAEEIGIEFRKINPEYTSQRCSCCGCIAEGNRETQDKFKCKACGYEGNADFNAAKNIAEPRIEKLIEDEFRRQEHEKVAYMAE